MPEDVEGTLLGGKSSDPDFCDTQAHNRQTDTQTGRETNRQTGFAFLRT